MQPFDRDLDAFAGDLGKWRETDNQIANGPSLQNVRTTNQVSPIDFLNVEVYHGQIELSIFEIL